jgi:nitroimidazol reductase NimA-like FMN-containing flavoprotein (pyridoxamine 5'-phosphate oxidase superfamily)
MPTTRFDPRFGVIESPTPWEEAEAVLRDAEVFWITTVRADGRPHVTPLLAAWDGGALHFCTGAEEQKAVNLRANDEVALTTGCNVQGEGLDVVVQGPARRITDRARLVELAHAWVAKYSEDWRFDVTEDAFRNEAGGLALVFAVDARTAWAFAKGEGRYGQTAYDF